MPSDKPIAKYLGIGRGSFRKAFLSVLLSKYSEKNAFDLAKKELGDNCIYCGISSKNAKLQPDFLWIQPDGGLLKLGNVVPACPTCNSSKNSMDWRVFIKSISNKISEKKSTERINRIEEYMKKYNMSEKPDINKYISENDQTIQKDLDLLLDALTLGLRSKVNMPQTKEVKFSTPDLLFDELVNISKKYLLEQNR